MRSPRVPSTSGGTADQEHATDRLVYDYFGLHRVEEPDGMVSFRLPFGEWIRLLRENGFAIERLIEPRPAADATSTFRDEADREWSRRWPSECVWVARREG